MEVTYEKIVAAVNAGSMVAIAPAVDGMGEPHIAMLVEQLSPVQRMALDCATSEQHARIAIKGVMQVRRHYGIERA